MVDTKKTKDNNQDGGQLTLDLKETTLDNIDATTGKDKDSSVDLKRCGGYIQLPAMASSVSYAKVYYPVSALTVCGINTPELVGALYDSLATKVDELIQQLAVKPASAPADSTGNSNLPDIAEVRGRKLIGNKFTLVLPKPFNKARATKGKAQTRSYLRAPTAVPTAGIVLLQYWINEKITGDDVISRIWGISGTVAYRVPKVAAGTDTRLIKMIAKGEKKTPPATTEAGTGQ